MDADRSRAPSTSFDEIEIRTADGVVLRAICLEPAGAPRASVVLAHAMFARKSSLRGLAVALADEGYRAIAFDFRDHGDSSPAKDWRYDQLVDGDLPAVVECVRARAEDHPVVVLGHSLGAHAAIAAQATGRMHADAIVMLGGNVWLRELEPSAALWATKRAVAAGLLTVADRVGSLPARRLRFGTDDASTPYIHDLLRGVKTDGWRSAEGVDYLAAMANVTVPVAAVLGDEDWIMCGRGSGTRFVRRCGGPIRMFSAPGGHMALRRAHGVVRDALAWALAQPSQARP